MSGITLFEEKQVRRAWNKDEEKWYFAIAAVIAVLTGSPNSQVYWRVMKKRLLEEGTRTVTNCNALKMTAADGKQRLTDVADTEQLLRLIQSIPSPKAEPFKLWLARVGYERLEDIENPAPNPPSPDSGEWNRSPCGNMSRPLRPQGSLCNVLGTNGPATGASRCAGLCRWTAATASRSKGSAPGFQGACGNGSPSKRRNAPASRSARRPAQRLEKQFAIPAIHRVVNSPSIFHSRFSWHRSRSAENAMNVNRQGLTPSVTPSGPFCGVFQRNAPLHRWG